jgi:hypothetical protein
MLKDPEHVRLEEVDWAGVLPVLRLTRSFRMALQPAKMLLALVLVVLIYVGGHVLDFAAGARVHPGEFPAFTTLTPAEFDAWLEGADQRTADELKQDFALLLGEQEVAEVVASPDRFNALAVRINALFDGEIEGTRNDQLPDEAARQERIDQFEAQRRRWLNELSQMRPRGVFETALRIKLDAAGRMFVAALSLRMGFADLADEDGPGHDTVLGQALVLWQLTRWAFAAHPWFMLCFCIWALLVTAFAGGAISRLAALHATRDERLSLAAAVEFAISRFGWFLLAPLLMLSIAGLFALLTAGGGFAFFNLPWLDLLGGLLFGLAILFGLIVTLILLGLALGWPLLFPAIAVEGTDAFDANSRAYAYMLGRPWRWLGYTAVQVVYGGLTYLLVGSVMFLALAVTQWLVGAWVFTENDAGANRFDALLAPPRLGELTQGAEWPNLDWPARGAAALIGVWVRLTVALVAAYGVSYFFCSSTWVYLLLRRSADGVAYDDVWHDDHAIRRTLESGDEGGNTAAETGAAPDKVEPGGSEGGGA